MNNNVTVIIRSCGERTTEYCRNIISKQVFNENIFIINETPFSKAVEKTFTIGIKQKKKWTLAIDADVLVRSDGIKLLLENANKLDDNYFIIQGKILDFLFGYAKNGGPHLYRTNHLNEALKLIPKEGKTFRPESYTYGLMEQRGYKSLYIDSIIAIHDYEQYFVDIYRKAFLHSKKHKENNKYLEKRWNLFTRSNIDFKIALKGLEDGKNYKENVSVDRKAFPSELKFVNGIKTKEKSKLNLNTDPVFIDAEIKKYLDNRNKKNEEIGYLTYVFVKIIRKVLWKISILLSFLTFYKISKKIQDYCHSDYFKIRFNEF